jgi:hypothetical protein
VRSGYLRWLARHEQEPYEQPPIGIILCAGKKQEQIELLELGKSGIHVAEYLTVLPPREALEVKLHLPIQAARSRLQDDRDRYRGNLTCRTKVCGTPHRDECGGATFSR